MTLYLVGYTIIALIIAFVVFVELVSHRIILKNNPKVFAIFANPLLVYSIKRIISALISILLAIGATYILIRVKVDITGDLICQKAISNWNKISADMQALRCATVKENLGVSGNWFVSLLSYFYKILPIPKTVCHTAYIYDDAAGTMSIVQYSCRNFIMDLGTVYFIDGDSGKYVIDVLFARMGASFKVTILATVFELALGYPMGMLMAKHKDGVFDKIGKAYIISIDAIPGVAYYYIWMTLFIVVLKMPALVHVDDPSTYWAPVLTMAFTGAAGIALWVRRFMLDEFNSDYVKFARAKGLSENRILSTHVLRNAIVPLIRSIPSAILGALLGSFYIEKIYGYSADGFGGLMIAANSQNDFYVIQGIIVITAFISIISYLLGDIVTAIVDPRISFSND